MVETIINMSYVKKIKPFFIDERGEISHLIEDNVRITSALLLTCKKGAIRANHYHKKDTHYSYLLKGKMEYTYKDMSSKKSKNRKFIVNEGDMVYTPPMIGHVMKFLEDSVFIALATEPRDRKDYENDTVRIDLFHNDR